MSPSSRPPCREQRPALDAWVDGVASSAMRERLEAHASRCERCHRALQEAKNLRSLLEAAPSAEPSKAVEDAFVNAVLGRIGGASRVVRPDHVDVGGRSLLRTASLAAAALLITLSVSAALLLKGRLPGALPAEERSSLVDLAEPPVASPEASVALAEEASAAPLLARTVPPPVEPARFRESLAAALLLRPFSPATDLSSLRWSRLVEHDLGVAETTRAARQCLRAEVVAAARAEISNSGCEAKLAARLLGHRGDYQDRRLLLDALGVIGDAAALALLERGPSGAAALWGVASTADAASFSARESARRCLSMVADRTELGWLAQIDVSADATFAAELIAASLEEAPEIFLEKLLDGCSEKIWLPALERHPSAGMALDRALAEALGVRGAERRRPSRGAAYDVTRKRLLSAVRSVPCDLGATFALRSLEAGEPDAAVCLAHLPGPDPLVSLISGTGAGAFRAEIEEEAWIRMGDERHGELAQLLPDLEAAPQWTALKALAVAAEHSRGAVYALLSVGASSRLDSERRVFATLSALDAAIADPPPDDPFAVDERARTALRSALDHTDERVAAAAALALEFLGEPLDELPAPVLRALGHEGTLHVRHLRVAREFQRASPGAPGRSL
ncbi:MAG: zf-HC2 domain-containing protein [Planctomycetota bacterium]